jgi:hypothetical protein
MKPQRLPEPRRRRRIPERFSWVDQRLVRKGYIERCGTPALALYLVLVTVADRDGVSYYSDRSLCRMLHWTPLQLKGARGELLRVELLAYQYPFYQVLGLDPATPAGPDSAAAASAADEAPATPEQVRAIIEAWEQEVQRG